MIGLQDLALKHLRVDADSDEAGLIALYLGASVQAASQFLNRQLFDDEDSMRAAVVAGTAGEQPMVANDLIRAAVLLILGHLYENREDSIIGVTAVMLPMGSRSLLQPYRVAMGV